MPKNPHANFSPVLDGYSGIGAFRFWCQTALPLTYDDSLSYYELLAKVVNYLNNTIEDLSAVEDNTSALAEAYDQLQDYVNDYFDDLDVEAELRNVLDAMAEDGTLDALLDPLVENQLPGVVDEKIDAVVAEQIDGAVGGQIDESVADQLPNVVENQLPDVVEEKIDAVVAEQIDGAVAGQIDESVADQLPPVVSEAIPSEVTDWLDENVDPVGSAVMVDSSLTISGAAADAKVTGDEVSNLKTQLNSNGIPKRYDYTGTANIIISQAFTSGVPVYLAVKSGTATGIRFDFRRSDNSRYSVSVNTGAETVYTPAENFVDVIAYPLPYNGESKSVEFYINQTANGIRQNMVDLEWSYRPELGFNVSAANYTDYFSDANDAPVGKAFVISSNVTNAMISHLPIYGQYGILYTLTGQKADLVSTQIYSGVTGTKGLWFRTCTASGSTQTYGDWKKIIDSEDWIEAVKHADIAYLISDIVKYGKYESTVGGQVFSQAVTAGERYRLYVWNITGAIADNPVLFLTPTGGSAVNLRSYKKDINGTYYWDVTIPANSSNIYLYGVKDSGSAKIICDYALIKITGGIADTLQTEIDTLPARVTNIRTCKIFKKVVCCGDSYTSGHIQLNGETAITTNEEFAWPHFMSTLTGNEWVNCGRSGATVLTWMTDARGLPKAQTTGQVQAYVVGLMINDQKTVGVGGVPLGTSADIGTDSPTTYYGGMSKIIRELNSISPLAKIFVCTCPMTGGQFADYNNAVRTIVETYKNTYPVHCLDLQANKELYANKSLVDDLINGHYTAIGYEQFSEIMAYIMSDYINNHVSDFQNVHKIPYGS